MRNTNRKSTEGCADVDDFRAAIKNKFPHLLNETLVTDLKEILWSPLVVTVKELPIKTPISSSKKQLIYKGLDVEASCRKYLDAIAKKLSLFYQFKWGQDNDSNYPTFGDVLFAYQTNAWDFIYRRQSYAERTDESEFTQVSTRAPILPVRLPDLFDADEWKQLQEWNQKTDIRIHDAKLRQTSSGKDIIIIPHDDYNQTTISFFKTIGVKAQLYIDESKLEVKDESDLS
ncbi:hypothetical protein RTP6_000840 [Batrachochytrium dendrobatidis]